MIIDSHQHFWDRGQREFDHSWQDDKPVLCRNFLPPDLRPEIDAVGVERTVFVQTQHNIAENRWVLNLAHQHDFIAGVVGWVDLASDECEQQLLEFIDDPKFVGVRHVTQDEADDNFIVRPEVLRGLRVLEKHRVPFDLLFYVRHLKHARRLAEELPELPMVIDHLAKPEIRDGRLDGWSEDLKAAASYPNLYCKLSGMITEADWQHWQSDDLRPYVELALEKGSAVSWTILTGVPS